MAEPRCSRVAVMRCHRYQEQGSAPSQVRSNQSVGNDWFARFCVSGQLEVADSS